MIVKWAVTVARTRSVLYSLARFLGDYQAIKRGRIGKRIANELLASHTGHCISSGPLRTTSRRRARGEAARVTRPGLICHSEKVVFDPSGSSGQRYSTFGPALRR